MRAAGDPKALDALLLCGPTASGKSAVALELAASLDAEIVSVDSMQGYRGMNIGTAKPSAEERSRIRHHLIDILEPGETFDAAAFLNTANAAVGEIRARGKMALLCGGTGLYFKAFLYGLGETPPSDFELKKKLETLPLSEMLRELESADPVTFERIDRQNPRRLIRALEVIRLTGRPFSQFRHDWSQPRTDVRWFLAGISREPGDLRRRIDSRVDKMFADGLVGETAALLEQGLEKNIVAMQALGYRQVAEHLRGERSLEETVALVKIRTWQFARRQLTWFRTQLRPQWVHAGPEASPAETARAVELLLRNA